MSTLYGSFVDAAAAERAAGALLDNGAQPDDISLLSNERTAGGQPVGETSETVKAEHSAKTGISTTTSADVAAGTVKGAAAGFGIGALAVLASLFIPGVGIVVGGGALATAVMAGTGTAIAGAAAGGVAGYLADQGVPDDVVVHYNKSFLDGGSILAIAVPTGSLTAEEAEAVMAKYGATNVATVNAPRMLSEGTAIQPDEPLVVQSDNPEIAPVAFATPAVPTARVVEEDIVAPGPMIEMIDPSSGVVTTQPVVPVAVDPTIGAEYVVPPMAPAAGVTTLPPNIELVPDSAGMYHQTVGHSTVVNEEPAIVTDPVTGLARSATIVEEQRAVVVDPAAMDVEGHAVVPIEGPEQTIIVREKHVEIPD